jgi:alcohol dehydrogenase (cytochrome c)
MTRRLLLATALLCAASSPLAAQVTEQRLVNAAQEPQNWLNYSGGYFSQRHRPLNQITPANAKNLELK